MKKFVAAIVIVILFAIPIFAAYMGVFNTLIFDIKEFGPYQLVYLEQTGDYAQTGKTMEQVESIVENANIETEAAFGIFYDDPSETPKEELRSEIGLILKKGTTVNPAKLTGGVKIKELRKQKYVYAEFANKNVLSYVLGPMMVYPKMSKRLETQNLSFPFSLEIYEQERILYLVPWLKNDR